MSLHHIDLTFDDENLGVGIEGDDGLTIDDVTLVVAIANHILSGSGKFEIKGGKFFALPANKRKADTTLN